MVHHGKRKCKKTNEIPSVSKPYREEQLEIPNINLDTDDINLLEKALYDKIEQQYQKALNILLCLEYSKEVALMGILNNGSIHGPSSNIMDNILRNSIFYLVTGHVVDSAFCHRGKPTFKDMKDVVNFSMQAMFNAIMKDRTKAHAIKYILSAICFFIPESAADAAGECSINSIVVENDDKDVQVKEASDVMLRLMGDDPNMVMPCWKHPTEKPDKKGNKQIMELTYQVANMRVKRTETKKWAEETVIQAAKKLNNDRMELRMLRSEKEGLNKKTEEISNNAVVLAELKERVRWMNSETANITNRSKHLENCNNVLKSGISATTLVTSEDECALRLLQKKEKRRQKIQSDKEKQEYELKKQIEEWKHKNAQSEADLLQTVENNNQLELKLRQETEAKKQARLMFQEVERLEKKGKEESMRLLAHKPNCQSGDGVAAPSGSNSCSGQRLCLICNTKWSNVLFLPCTHQVTCEDCNRNSLHNSKNVCLLCMVRIEKKIKVYGS